MDRRPVEVIKKWNAGGTTWCEYCSHYREKEEGEKCMYDGFCDLPLVCNGVKSKKPFHPVRFNWGSGCHDWIDRETGLTAFEVKTRLPERSRSPLEIEHLSKFITWKETERS